MTQPVSIATNIRSQRQTSPGSPASAQISSVRSLWPSIGTYPSPKTEPRTPSLPDEQSSAQTQTQDLRWSRQPEESIRFRFRDILLIEGSLGFERLWQERLVGSSTVHAGARPLQRCNGALCNGYWFKWWRKERCHILMFTLGEESAR